MRLRRNDPCPCGSGKKYKRCCGADTPPAPGVPAGARVADNRHCGDCTACCDGWIKIRIHSHDVHPGKPCPYSTGHGCSIYAERPQDPCRGFICGWLERDSPLPEWFRPDRIGLILLRAQFRWRGLVVDVAVPAGRDPGGPALEWLQGYSARAHRPLVYQQGGLWYSYGPAELQSEVQARMTRGERLW